MLPRRFLTYKGKKQPILHWALELRCSTGSLWKFAEEYGEDMAVEEFLKRREKRNMKEKLFSHVRS